MIKTNPIHPSGLFTLENKRYLVTDICYVVPNTLWSGVCDEMFKEGPNTFDEDDMAIISVNTVEFMVFKTTYGDGRYEAWTPGGSGPFSVDSGTFCVVDYDDAVKLAGEEVIESLVKLRNGCEVDLTDYEGDFNFEMTKLGVIEGVITVNTSDDDHFEEDDMWDDEEDEEN